METHSPLTYLSTGVDTEQEEGGLRQLRHWVEQTFSFGPRKNAVRLPLGYYANVLDIGGPLSIAISTDGVGTKIIIAQMMGRLDTVGIDCVAMNVNDVICVGAEPIAMVDYIAVESADPDVLGELAKGLFAGAKLANISIPGGEVAQIREMIRGVSPGAAFDLVGTCVGTVRPDHILHGQDISPGDAIVGLNASGIHSNGATLARHVFFEQNGWKIDRYVPELGRTIGEELLEPTLIYVPPAMQVLNAGIPVKAFAHITSDGFLNLSRADAAVGYRLDNLPQIPPIFELIRSEGHVEYEEMFRVYNMGIGFCIIVPPEFADETRNIARDAGFQASVIGHAVADDEKRVYIPSFGLVGRDGRFYRGPG